MLVVTGKVLDYGADYLSLSEVMRDGSPDKSLLWSWAVSRVDHSLNSTDRTKEVRFGGYKGISWSIGREKVGQRHREGNIDVLYQCSGYHSRDAIAAAWFLEHDEKGKNVKVTRFDEQVTIQADFVDTNLIADYYELLAKSKSEGYSLSGRRGAVLYRSEGGDTIYIGSRTSKGNMYRVYDKSKDYGLTRGQVWRFEVERGRDTAADGLSQYTVFEPESHKIQRLADEFTLNCGLSFRMPIRPLDNYSEALVSKLTSEDEYHKMIDWLRRCVSKPVKRLVGAGYTDDVERALGVIVSRETIGK